MDTARAPRDGLDLRIALAHGARGIAPGAAATPAPAAPPVPPAGARGLLSAALRLMRPLLSPLAFRTRRYLTAELDAQLRAASARLEHDLAHTAHALTSELRTGHQDLREQIARAYADTQLRQQAQFNGLLHELTATSDTLRGDLDALRDRNSALQAQLERLDQYCYASARRVALACGAGDVLLKTEVGYLLCDGADLAVLATLVDTGDLERGTRLLIGRLLAPGDVFVDVGAHIGVHTLAAARAMQGRGQVIAFEPFERSRQLLEQSVWLNGFTGITRIHAAAAAERDGSATLHLGAGSGLHSLFAHDDGGRGEVAVVTARLDQAIGSETTVTLLKIDAEGAELSVIAGASGLLERCPDLGLIIEFGPSHLRRSGLQPDQWLARFAALGFNYRVIDPHSGALTVATEAELLALESSNLFMARPGSTLWSKLGEHA